MPPFRSMSYRRVARKFRVAGFVDESQNGSHVKFVKREDGVVVTWKAEMGKPGQLGRETVARQSRRVSQYKRGNRAFKIGITSDPDRRAMEYDSRDGYRSREMVVLYQTGSADRVRYLESMLVSKHQDADNEWGGGGGPLGKKPHYLYIVRSLPRRRGVRIRP